jgi:hypothetical protein
LTINIPIFRYDAKLTHNIYGIMRTDAGFDIFQKTIIHARMANHIATIIMIGAKVVLIPKNTTDHAVLRISCAANNVIANCTALSEKPFLTTRYMATAMSV